ncbi:hypothetical protein TNCV_4967801 [Trichonephila clavipes]|nr:hypothetical protein TNCV_4967801 [Trichonephila clavipes]
MDFFVNRLCICRRHDIRMVTEKATDDHHLHMNYDTRSRMLMPEDRLGGSYDYQEIDQASRVARFDLVRLRESPLGSV